MPRIEMTTTVRATREAVFDASVDVDLHTRSMGASAERAIDGVMTGRLKVGDTVRWQAVHFGIPWRMTVRITQFRRPSYFVDEQVRGPFTQWRHEHNFMPDPTDPSITVMRDVIGFIAPAGPVGAVVAHLILKPYLQRLIGRRNAFLAASVTGSACTTE
ncbi:SRPBCC family protein [Micromonospora sp. WMMD1120]|uniref:SRPBCC family protein n=1 Tax=Micromonospora sp. WMMD1120 TaxID=3016106 RepID=UPI002416FA5B|nr:SRPBCC family protein [Micromonospora sp. WMMD1120]MDG4808710.1 SRPBCC family protein [Micromonospora sp. WMMD1120]